MAIKVSKNTYESVINKYGSKCYFPGCTETKIELSHIIFRSEVVNLADNPNNLIPLCANHHRENPKFSVHKSNYWKKYYYKYLPIKWQENINDLLNLKWFPGDIEKPKNDKSPTKAVYKNKKKKFMEKNNGLTPWQKKYRDQKNNKNNNIIEY